MTIANNQDQPPGRRLSDLPDVLTVAEVATLLGVSRNLVWRAIAEGQIGTLRLGRRVLVPKAFLHALLAGAIER
jgi:excisionase family DNA binding protein